MTTSTVFEDVLEATQWLSFAQKSALVYRLQSETEVAQEVAHYPLTRVQAQAELQALRVAGVFAHSQSLYGKYAQSSVDLDKETLQAAIDEAATAWETELDEFAVTED
jgi:hypothetical protein